jgi:hypothetical protein
VPSVRIVPGGVSVPMPRSGHAPRRWQSRARAWANGEPPLKLPRLSLEFF